MIDLGPKAPENRIHLFDPVGLINEKYANYGARPRHATPNAAGGGLRLTVEPKAANSDSPDGSSPRLWNPNGNTSPPTSPRFTTSPPPHQLQNHSHQQHHQNPESMSPNSRIQAIARGRRELMDMIKDMPESYYELSLRDIVDHKSSPSPPAPPSPAAVEVKPPQKGKKVEVVAKKLPQEEAPKDKKKKKEGKKKKVGKSESKKKMMKNRSVDNGGFLLKTTVFPIPFRSKKKKRSLSAVPSFKVAPKTNPKGADKHWWVRKARVSNDAESTSTSRSSSIVSRHRQNTRFLPSCCSFFSDKKMKSKK